MSNPSGGRTCIPCILSCGILPQDDFMPPGFLDFTSYQSIKSVPRELYFGREWAWQNIKQNKRNPVFGPKDDNDNERRN